MIAMDVYRFGSRKKEERPKMWCDAIAKALLPEPLATKANWLTYNM